MRLPGFDIIPSISVSRAEMCWKYVNTAEDKRIFYIHRDSRLTLVLGPGETEVKRYAEPPELPEIPCMCAIPEPEGGMSKEAVVDFKGRVRDKYDTAIRMAENLAKELDR